MYDTNNQPNTCSFLSNLVSVLLKEAKKKKLGTCISFLNLMYYSKQFKQFLDLIFIERRDSH